jgi:hypothetical protein
MLLALTLTSTLILTMALTLLLILILLLTLVTHKLNSNLLKLRPLIRLQKKETSVNISLMRYQVFGTHFEDYLPSDELTFTP